ncbi:hypothetical protein BC938DRAFT_471357 [Jimgerdemannia flammicorona]|uniref:Uncharacterized protein n=1 Tax=Jimgerdemannia flammicorona TaxID=994334 RepID=A0A433QUM8_9FUNG|nr:hypothetical protein BC938DRAFT_471357 [Jimgerdemannia flammicorona]
MEIIVIGPLHEIDLAQNNCPHLLLCRPAVLSQMVNLAAESTGTALGVKALLVLRARGREVALRVADEAFGELILVACTAVYELFAVPKREEAAHLSFRLRQNSRY